MAATAALHTATAAVLGGAAALALVTVEALSLYSIVDPAQWCPFCKCVRPRTLCGGWSEVDREGYVFVVLVGGK
jgi:hypothetical protein